VNLGLLTAAPAALLQVGRAVRFDVGPNVRFSATGNRSVLNPNGTLSWSGPTDVAFGSVQLVLTEKGVTGDLRVEGSLYRFEPIGGGLHALTLVRDFPPEHPPSSPAGSLSPSEEPPPGGSGSPASAAPFEGPTSTMSGALTKLDVLVVYTASAANASGDIAALIQLAIDETNTSYSNSGITIEARDAFSAQVDYDESNRTYAQHVAALQSPSDGIMDNVHSLRSQYKADVVVLLVNDTDFCGLASVVNASVSTAFAAVFYDCATGNYSFGHEIGHLQGARHDRFVDSNNSPYAYGHGYVDPVNYNWRTIMAYDSSCVIHAGHHCARVQYWSNPNVTYPPTGQAMGTTTYEHDARVLEERKLTVANFVSYLGVSWTGPSTVGHNDYCPWTATITNGTEPYSYNWYATWQTSSTGFFFTSGQGTPNATSWGYYYGSYPNPTQITVQLYGSDAVGENYSLPQRTVNLYNYSFGCY